MPTIDSDTINRIISKFGSTIDLTAKPGILEEIIREVRDEEKARGGVGSQSVTGAAAGRPYNRSYTEGGWYGKTYYQYDKTVDGFTIEPVYKEVEKLTDRVLLEKLRTSLGTGEEKGKE